MVATGAGKSDQEGLVMGRSVHWPIAPLPFPPMAQVRVRSSVSGVKRYDTWRDDAVSATEP